MRDTTNTDTEMWKLPEDFFRSNPMDEQINTGQLLDFQMRILLNDKINELIEDFSSSHLSSSRMQKCRDELAGIEELSSP